MRCTRSAWAVRLAFALLALPAAGPAAAEEQLKLVTPGCSKALAFAKGGFELQPAQISPDGNWAQFFGVDSVSGLKAGFTIQRAKECRTGRECRDRLWKQGFKYLGGVGRVVVSEIGAASVIEVYAPDFGGTPIQEYTVFAELVVEGCWANVEVFKTGYTPRDQAPFESFVRSIAFVPRGGESVEGKKVVRLEGRRIAVALPPDWSYARSMNPRTGLPTVEMADPKEEIHLEVSFLPEPKGKRMLYGALLSEMERTFEPYLAHAVERKMQFSLLNNADGEGAYTVFTDPELAEKGPVKGQWILATRGMRSWYGAYLVFTLRSNSRRTDTYHQALELVRTGIHEVDEPTTPRRQ